MLGRGLATDPSTTNNSESKQHVRAGWGSQKECFGLFFWWFSGTRCMRAVPFGGGGGSGGIDDIQGQLDIQSVCRRPPEPRLPRECSGGSGHGHPGLARQRGWRTPDVVKKLFPTTCLFVVLAARFLLVRFGLPGHFRNAVDCT